MSCRRNHGEAGSAKFDRDSTVMSLLRTALEKSAFHDQAQAAVGYSTSRGSISTKKCAVTGRFAGRGFWKRGMPKIATRWGGRGSDLILRLQRAAVGDFWVRATRIS